MGKARRTGTAAASLSESDAEDGASGAPPPSGTLPSEAGNGATPALAFTNGTDAGLEAGAGVAATAAAAAEAVPNINRRCKRKRRELLAATSSGGTA